MKKKIMTLVLSFSLLAMTLAGCGSAKTQPDVSQDDVVDDITNDQTSDDNVTEDDSNDVAEEVPEVDNHEDDIRSELTNEWIPNSNEDYRPVAVMIPNDKSTLPHYSISEAGVLYQCQVEGSITRLMALFDDYENLGNRIGNVRSARTYYVYWAMEWDALFVHFGNPWYADAILESGQVADINLLNMNKGTEDSYGETTETGLPGEYYRASDRNAPQNAYISPYTIKNAIALKGYSTTHTTSYKGAHYQFADETNPVDLSTNSDAVECLTLDLSGSYPIDKTYFQYDSSTKQYLRYQYGAAHMDEATGEQLAFTNIIVQFTNWRALDEKGYLEFYFKEGLNGFYITNGYAIPITWEKSDDYAITKYYDANGNEITLNTGKTMVCIVENTDEDEVIIK